MTPSDEITCIFCAERKKGSREHVIPRSLGGNLVIKHVCQDCNSVLGRVADSEFETNSYIAVAYKEIGWEGRLIDLMKKAEITAIDMNSLISMKLKIKVKNEFQIIPQELKDGSRIVGEEESTDVITKIIARRREEYLKNGLSDEKIEEYKRELLEKYAKADPYSELELPDLGLKLIKHSSVLDKKIEYSKTIPLRGVCKIGYELLFLVIGHRSLEARFESYRKYPLGADRIPAIYQLFGSKRKLSFSPIHQLYLVEKSGKLVCGVRLFRGYPWEMDFGPNDIDAFGAYNKFCSCEKSTGLGIEMNLEKNINRVLIRTDSEKWEEIGSIE
jgi:hypothetical protein